MKIISDTQSTILNLLGRFKFLTVSQMQPLIDKSTGYIRIQLADLSKNGFIKCFQLSKTFKTEGMYYLTEGGKELILQHTKTFDTDLKLPIGQPLLVKDYTHRKNMISLTIALYYHITGLGITIIEMMSYFDKQGDNRKSGNLEARTKIPIGNGFFIPDGIMLTEHENSKAIYFLEMYCDASSTRCIEQIQKHVLAIAEGSPAAKFGIKVNPIVLACFEHEGVKNKVIEKLKNEAFAPFAGLFYFTTIEDVKTNCANAWQNINGAILQLK